MRRMALVLALAACSGSNGANGKNGATGPAGPRGPAGQDGASGASAAGYRWVDAEGEPVTVGSELTYVDEAGFVWGVDPETAELTVATTTSTYYYESDDCSGPAYVDLRLFGAGAGLALPRMVVVVRDEYRARGDTASPETVCMASLDAEGGCLPADGSCPGMFAAQDLKVVTAPNAAWAPPLHPEPISP